jgi:GTPase SAR1 family protein
MAWARGQACGSHWTTRIYTNLPDIFAEASVPDLTGFSWLLPAAKEAYDNREAIQGGWKKLAAPLFGGKKSIAFTGMPGVGKTVLVDHLTGAAFRQGYKPPGKSQVLEVGKVSRNRKRLRFSVIPGQESAPRLDATDDLFGDNAVDGIVHVVANGFIEIRNQTAREALISEGGLATLANFREHQRQQELADLDETCELIRSSLRSNDKPKWMLVVVDKVDLYYEEIREAEAYYSPEGNSAFAQRLTELQNRVGRDRFDWAAIPGCSWLEDFEWNGEVAPSRLKPYERDYYVAQLLRVIESYSARK